MFTSGTTGEPKGAIITHNNLLCAIDAYTQKLNLTAADSTILAVPIYHITGLSALLALFRHGASLGGVGIMALYLQDRTGFKAGWTQMIFDACVFALALALRDWRTVAWSALGALVLNMVIAINHRRDRYVA
jgi:uncharacterized membrane-anchored protein YitT (DUF2179 family)